jgi:hypothetical protein
MSFLHHIKRIYSRKSKPRRAVAFAGYAVAVVATLAAHSYALEADQAAEARVAAPTSRTM